MVRHKSRKELRIEAQTAASELAELKTPEGLARFLYSKRDDKEFHDAVETEIWRLKGEEEPTEPSVPATIEQVTGQETTPASAAETPPAPAAEAPIIDTTPPPAPAAAAPIIDTTPPAEPLPTDGP